MGTTRLQHDHVTRHQAIDRDSHDGPVAPDVGMDCDRALQRLGGALGAVLLDQVEPDRENDDSEDDAEAAKIAGLKK